jgi:hypothetical protein
MQDHDRETFQESLQSLSGVLSQPSAYEQVVWKIEYLSNSNWYHFYGMIRDGQSSGVGHRYDRISRTTTALSPDECISVALGFNANLGVVAYRGERSFSFDILDEIESEGAGDADVIRIAFEIRDPEAGGRPVTSVTDVAYVGLAVPDRALGLKSLALDEGPSRQWCRDRRFIGSSSVPATAGTHRYIWI